MVRREWPSPDLSFCDPALVAASSRGVVVVDGDGGDGHFLLHRSLDVYPKAVVPV
jgi:hypothetical protein